MITVHHAPPSSPSMNHVVLGWRCLRPFCIALATFVAIGQTVHGQTKAGGEGIKGSDFQLLDAQRSRRDGGLELIEFVSRKSVQENIAFFSEQLMGRGWKKAQVQQHGEVQQLRFEKEGRYIRLGMWPHAFSDNAGSYQGTKGAAEGTGLIWSDRVPSGNVPERQLADAERYLGKLSKEKREWLVAEIRRKREAAFWPEGAAIPAPTSPPRSGK